MQKFVLIAISSMMMLASFANTGAMASTSMANETKLTNSSELVQENTHRKNQYSPDAFVNGMPMLQFKDYHAQVDDNGKSYLLDSYVIPWENPFFIHIRTIDGSAIELNDASRIAIDYIKPKGCTEPLVRKPNLDKSSTNKSEWIIGVSC